MCEGKKLEDMFLGCVLRSMSLHVIDVVDSMLRLRILCPRLCPLLQAAFVPWQQVDFGQLLIC
jgi:hypothetical protein